MTAKNHESREVSILLDPSLYDQTLSTQIEGAVGRRANVHSYDSFGPFALRVDGYRRAQRGVLVIGATLTEDEQTVFQAVVDALDPKPYIIVLSHENVQHEASIQGDITIAGTDSRRVVNTVSTFLSQSTKH